MMVRTLGVVTLLLLLGAVSGCGSIPPEAEPHAAALLEYHRKTTAGTLKAFDTSLEGQQFAIATLGGQVEQLWRSYLDDVGASADALHAVQVKAGAARARLADGGDEAALALLDEAISDAAAEEATLREYLGIAREEMSADVAAMNQYRMDVARSGGELRALIAEHHEAVGDGIALHEQLFASYNMAALSRREFFGGKLDGAREKLTSKADEAFSKFDEAVRPYMDIVKKLMGER